MRSAKIGSARWSVAAGVAAATVAFGASAPAAAPSIRDAPGKVVAVRLVDAATGDSVVGSPVTVLGDDALACQVPPCPVDQRQWRGTADSRGRILLPTSVIMSRTWIETAALFGDLIADSRPDGRNLWVVELLPKAVGSAPGAHPLKLIDASTHAPISNSPVYLEFDAKPGWKVVVRTATNVLGYLFVPIDVVARAPDRTWIVVPGYRPTLADFAFVRRKTVLTRL